MEEFEIHSLEEDYIILKHVNDIERIYNALTKDGGDAIVVIVENDGQKIGELLQPPMYSGKIMNGDFKISSKNDI